MCYIRGFDVYHVGSVEGLSLWWEDWMKVKVVFSTRNLINSDMRMIGDDAWFQASWIYGIPYRAEKH